MSSPRSVRWLLVGVAIAFAVMHVVALFTEAINWDEIALLDRVNKSLHSGSLQAGGRPGLGVIAMMPLVDGCHDTVATIRAVRVLWCVFTFALLGGAFVFVRAAIRRTANATAVAGLAVFLFACVPLFLRWSLHARTDQPAIAAALWGGVALLASRRRTRWSLAAGALVAVGYLFSQKAIYIGGLVGVVALGDLYIEGARPDVRVQARRIIGAAVGAGAVLVAYKLLVPLFFKPASVTSFDEGTDLFKWYRLMLRYRMYPAMSSSVYPMIGLLVLSVAATWRAFRVGSPERRPLLISLAVMALGVAVGWFHAASFPYFWMTIGIFPVTAIALAWSGIREWLPRAHLMVAIVCVVVTSFVAVAYRRETLVDTQAIQRATYDAIDRLPPALRGFHPDGGLVCRADPDPMLVYLGQHIARRFKTPEATQNFISEFRHRPIAFVVETFRFRLFPRPVREFWDATYLPYAGAVRLAGQRIDGARTIEIVVGGRYRWRGSGPVAVAHGLLGDGDTIELPAGRYEARPNAGATGTLWLDVDVPYQPDRTPFYSEMTTAELSGIRREWW